LPCEFTKIFNNENECAPSSPEPLRSYVYKAWTFHELPELGHHKIPALIFSTFLAGNLWRKY